jgi:hypothetical protein
MGTSPFFIRGLSPWLSLCPRCDGGKMDKKRRERIIAIFLMAGSIYLGWQAREFPMDGSYFPLFTLGGIFLLSLYLLILSFFTKESAVKEEKKEFNFRPFVLFAILIVQILFVKEIGYFFSSALFLVAASLYLGIRNYRLLILTVLILIPSMYVFFVWGLQANLPQGILF